MQAGDAAPALALSMTAVRLHPILLPLCLHRRRLRDLDGRGLQSHVSVLGTALHLQHSAGDAGSALGVPGLPRFDGRKGLRTSHLPRFHAAHDAQIVLALWMDDPAVKAAMRPMLARSPARWMLAPERFDLHVRAPHA
jgi:hypothetical protein